MSTETYTDPNTLTIQQKLDYIITMLERLMPLLDAIESNPMVKGMLGS